MYRPVKCPPKVSLMPQQGKIGRWNNGWRYPWDSSTILSHVEIAAAIGRAFQQKTTTYKHDSLGGWPSMLIDRWQLIFTQQRKLQQVQELANHNTEDKKELNDFCLCLRLRRSGQVEGNRTEGRHYMAGIGQVLGWRGGGREVNRWLIPSMHNLTCCHKYWLSRRTHFLSSTLKFGEQLKHSCGGGTMYVQSILTWQTNSWYGEDRRVF